MKVFIINSMCGSGSTGRIVADTYSILKLRGNEVKIAYGLGQAINVDNEDVIKINNKVGYYCHNIMARFTDRTGLFSKRQTRYLINAIDSFGPDLVQLHNLHGYWVNYKLLFEYLIKKNIPIVWTLHDCWSFTGHCAHFDYCGCEKWKIMCEDCEQLKEYPKCYFKGNVKKNYFLKKELYDKLTNLTIVTPSRWLANLVADSILGKHRICVINNGIDLDVFRPSKSLFREQNGLMDKVVLLSVANAWNERKGLNDLIDLSKQLPTNYKLVIVGLTEKQMQLLPDNILGIQRTSSIAELAEIYSSADVFINLTYEDTFPTVNIEALACGVPVVSYNTGGSSEIFDSSSGIVVEKGKMNEIISAINKALTLSRQDAKKRSEIYSKNDKYYEYVSLYESIVYEDKGNFEC